MPRLPNLSSAFAEANAREHQHEVRLNRMKHERDELERMLTDKSYEDERIAMQAAYPEPRPVTVAAVQPGINNEVVLTLRGITDLCRRLTTEVTDLREAARTSAEKDAQIIHRLERIEESLRPRPRRPRATTVASVLDQIARDAANNQYVPEDYTPNSPFQSEPEPVPIPPIRQPPASDRINDRYSEEEAAAADESTEEK